MRPAIHAVVAIVTAAILSIVAFGQGRSSEPIKTVRISGRIIDIAGRPLSDLIVNFRNLKVWADHRKSFARIRTECLLLRRKAGSSTKCT